MIDFDKLAADLANATPGPWRVEENTTLVWGECDHDDLSTYGMGYPIAFAFAFQTDRTWRKNRISEKNADANASLIAAAPDLARFALLVPELREALKHAALNMPHPDQCIDVALAKLDALLEGK